MTEGDDRKWRRVLDGLVADIRSGDRPVGSRIPSPRDLVARFDADRNTIRRATDYLRDIGVLESRPGSGMFVAVVPPDPLPQPVKVSPLERRVNARIDGLEARIERLERNQPPTG